MDYNKLVAVSGLPGVFELINSKTDGAIVRSLEDKTTRFVSSRIHNFSHLESIEIYTVRDNVNLVDVFNAMENASDQLPDDKDPAAVKKYFEKVFPDMDFDRVYPSDMKKIIKWFPILKKNNVEIKLTPEPEEEPVEETPEPEVKEKPAKKAAPKKEVKEEEEKEEKKTAKPAAKKTAAKKAAPKKEEKEEKKAAKPAAKKAAKK